MKKSKSVVLTWVAVLSATLVFASYYHHQKFSLKSVDNLKSKVPVELISTEDYIADFDPRRYELAGADYFNPRYSLTRLNKPLDQIDITYDYPFEYLNNVTDRLRSVDRRQALKSIFEKVTAGAATNLERHLAVLKFLQKSSFHNYIQPMYEDKQAVFDPLVLLELGEMRCGAVARLGVDLFEAAGYKGRLVQAHSHVSAEIYYDGSWHFFEADLSGGPPVLLNGQLPSLEELARTPYIVDRVPSRFELFVGPIPDYNFLHEGKYRSYYLFSKEALGTIKEAYYYKVASESEVSGSKWYGWNYYKIDSNRWPLTSMKPKYEPSAPIFKSVKMLRGNALVSWHKVNDVDDDFLGYRVFISSHSRGWNYKNKSLSKEIEKYVLSGWKPEMYDNMYKEPPSDIGMFAISENSIQVQLTKGQSIFLTVMAFDKHGESVGRRLYNMSPELAIIGE